uniref:LisH domain-containing protein n=1 Tax=Parastrongyloides trichosuri TaxID=131310 RepID=A0A0N4ZYJ4_PARTI
MVDRRNYDKLVKIEAETLFENFLIKYNYTNTLNAFKEESKILSARSRDSEIVRKFSYDQLEDIIKNTALLENTDKIYLYHTCRSFIDSLCDSARNLKTFLQQNSVLSLSRINSTGNDSPVSLTQPLGSADNNEGAFRYLNQPAIYNGTQGNNNFIKYEHQFGANNFSPSIQCSQNVIYPNSTTFPAYSNGPNNYYNYHQNNRIHSHYGNESSYVGRSDSAGERSDNSIGRSIGHNGNMNGYSSNFLPNGSSTPRTGVNGYGECTSNQESYLTSQRYSTPVQRYHINGPSEYSNNKSYIFQDNTQVNNGTFAPDSMSSSGSIQSQVNGVSYVESKEKSNVKQPRGSNSASKGVKQRKAKNPKDVTTKSTTAAKRRNNSNDVDEATKVPKLDNNVDQGVLNFQTPLNFSHFGKAAKDVDLEKEPYLAKSYSSNISNDSRNVGLSNVQNIVGKIDQYKQFNENCNKGNKNAYKLMNNKSSSCSVITGPILKKSGSKNSTAKLDDTYESTTQYTSFKEKPLTESTIMNCDNGDSNMVSHDSCNDVTNYFADINTGGSDVQDLAQELILDGESDFVFGMDTSILTDPGRTFDLFDEIGYNKDEF